MDAHILGVRDRQFPDDWRGWGAKVYAHAEVGLHAFGWAPGLQGTLRRLAPDIVDAQGLWMFPSLASLAWHRRGRRPYVITPRGMLDPWTLRRSAWKKRIVAGWFEDEHLRRAACLRALNANEARAFRAYGLSNPIAVVPNGIGLPSRAIGVGEASRTVLFLGRIDPKKGLAELLRAWAIAMQTPAGAGWRLRVTGWGDADYVKAMQALAVDLGIEKHVDFTGPCFGEEKARAFESAACFVLPSFSEGLPMAVLEAWSYGLPVLMTQACNLPEGFAAGAALEIVTAPGQMAQTLCQLMAVGDAERHAMGAAGRRLVEERFTWDHIAADMHEVYAWVLGGGSSPACVITD